MKTAKFIKKLKGWAGDARLYELSHEISYEADGRTKYVIVSAVDLRIQFDGHMQELFSEMLEPLETFIFPADKDGCILNWVELKGSYKGDLNHELALEGLGFKSSVIDKSPLLIP